MNTQPSPPPPTALTYNILTAWHCFSLQPSKLDLDVLIAIGQTTIDPAKYPHIKEWKKLVMSYSEATQER